MNEINFIQDMGLFHDNSLERTLLGLLIMNPRYIKFVEEDTFYLEKHKIIFKNIQKLHEKDGQVNFEVLALNCGFEASYIASLLDGIPKANETHIKQVVDKLLEFKKKRKIFILSQRVQDTVKGELDHETLHAILSEMKEEGFQGSGEESKTIEEILQKFKDYIAQGEGIRLGIPTLDNIMRGLGEGEVLYLLGRAKVAKSALVQNILHFFSYTYPHFGAIFFSLEMPDPQVAERVLMIGTNKPKEAVRQLSQIELDEVIKRHQNIFYITKTMNLHQIYQTILQQKFRSKIKLVIIDFITRIQTKIQDEYDFLRMATKGFKDFAKELQVGIIIVAQTGREGGGEGWQPLKLTSGRGSGTIEEDADFILGVYRPELNPRLDEGDQMRYRDIVILQFLGSRRTESGINFELHFNKQTLKMSEITMEGR